MSFETVSAHVNEAAAAVESILQDPMRDDGPTIQTHLLNTFTKLHRDIPPYSVIGSRQRGCAITCDSNIYRPLRNPVSPRHNRPIYRFSQLHESVQQPPQWNISCNLSSLSSLLADRKRRRAPSPPDGTDSSDPATTQHAWGNTNLWSCKC